MQKKLLSLSLIVCVICCLVLYGCPPPPPPCSSLSPIQWGNKDIAYFSPVKLSISGDYYKVNTGRTQKMLDSYTPITDFYEVFQLPEFAGQNSSSIKVTTGINSICIPAEQDALAYIDQTYKSIYSPHPVNHSLPSTAINNDLYTSTPFFADHSFSFWRANRDYKEQYIWVEVYSGPYENSTGNWYKLYWAKKYETANISNSNISVSGDHINVNVGSFNTMGAAKNVTPNRPFYDKLILYGTVEGFTLENVQTGKSTTLQVTYK